MGKKKLRQRIKKDMKAEDHEEEKVVRTHNSTYELLDSQFEIKDFKPIQYASAYFIRLTSLREGLVLTAAK